MAARLAAALDGARRRHGSATRCRPTRCSRSSPREHIEALQSRHTFYVWDENADQVRWMTSWSTTEADVDAFAADVRATVTP